MNKKLKQVRYSEEYSQKIDLLKRLYNITSKSKLLEHIVDVLISQNGGANNLKNNLK